MLREEEQVGLPVEAEGGELIHVAAVDLGQGVGPQGAAIHQPYVPAGGAPGLQLLLYTSQDLFVVRRGDLGAVTPVHLQGAYAHPAQSAAELPNFYFPFEAQLRTCPY